MNRPGQARQLEQFLSDLPSRHVRKLALVLERQRSAGKSKFPHDAIMRILRPSLAAMRMPRHLTPQRALCAPFEDLLRPDDPEIKQIGAISRGAIPVMWGLLEETEPDRLADLCTAFTDAQKDDDRNALAEASRGLWQLAAECLKPPLDKAMADPLDFKAFAKRTGGSRRVEDLREMQAILEIAVQVENVKALLPRKPISALSDDHITMISRVYGELAKEQPDHEAYLLMVVLCRLEQKFELLKVIRSMSPKMDDTLATRTDLKFAGDLVITALENEAEAIAYAKGAAHDEDRFMELVRRYAANFKGITGEMGIRREGEWGQRMYSSRTVVSESIERNILATAVNTVLSALPTMTGPKGIAVAAPDFSAAIDNSLYMAAERRARALYDTAFMSEQLGVANSARQAIETIKRELSRYGAMLIETLSKTAPEEVSNATNHLYVTVRLLEIVSTPEEADLLRRRGVAGLGLPAQPQPDADDGLQATIAAGRADTVLRPDLTG